MRTITRFAAAAAVALSAGAVGLRPAGASSHSEAPGLVNDRAVDGTDVYAFVSPDAPTTVTIVANYIPLEEPAGGPNYASFADDALYEVHVDNDGDAIEDLTYQFRFTTTTKNLDTFLYNTGVITYNAGLNAYDGLNVEQRYEVSRIVGPRRTGARTVLGTGLLVAPANVGDKSIPGGTYDTNLVPPAIHTLAGGVKVFCGPRDDPFFVFLGRAFDLLNVDPVLPGGKDSQCGTAISQKDHLAGYNVHTIALQIPKALLTSDGSPGTSAADPASTIGVWSTSSRRQVRLNRTGGREPIEGGAWVEVSRLGMPLVNELVIARADKDKWNESEPKDDAQFLTYVTNPELATIIPALFPGVAVPPTPRTDLVQTFLTGLPGLNAKGVPAEYIRLNMGVLPSAVPNRMGALAGQSDGFPNGRRLVDDVVDIELQVVIGALVPGFECPPESARSLGDVVCQNDKPFLATFPYVASPHAGSTRQH